LILNGKNKNTAASFKLQAASEYKIQVKAKNNTAASFTLHATGKYKIQQKAKSRKPKAKYNTAVSGDRYPVTKKSLRLRREALLLVV